MTPMTTDQVTEIINANKGAMATLTISGTSPTGPVVVGTLTGTIISINSKGVNIKDDNGVTVSRSLSRVVWVELADADEDMDEDTEADFIADMVDAGVYEVEADDVEDAPGTDTDALVAELDGATTAELANVFGIAAKELRVTLRTLGMGVGKGRRYNLTADQITIIRAALAPVA